MQFGASFIHPSQTSSFCVYCNGLFTFSGALSGDPMADFVAGALGSMTQLNISHDDENWRYLGLYAQDSWKVNSRLTLNYGLRWEPYLGGTFPLGQVSHFNMADFLANVHSTRYPNAPAGTLYSGDPGFQTGSRPSYTTWNDWAPRIGLAWDPTGGGKTLIRASWGILYDTPETLFFYNYAGQPLWGEGITIIPPAGAGHVRESVVLLPNTRKPISGHAECHDPVPVFFIVPDGSIARPQRVYGAVEPDDSKADRGSLALES